MRRRGRTYLDRLLTERNQHPERAALIDEKVRKAFECRVAILALDMCGFSRLADRFGIIHFLAMIHQMQQAACPAVTSNGGRVVKQEADNLFAVFGDSVQALEGALDIFRAFEAMNAVLPEDRGIHGSIGIGYGNTLLIGGEDLFGTEMNGACKLGEDLAGKGEILLTPAAHDALPPKRYAFAQTAFRIGDFDIPCYRFEKCLYTRRRKPRRMA
jgi:adenylate cyclase